MQIQMIEPGLLSTVQDLGRTGHRSSAVPVSGTMDSLSARVANLALGNAASDAVIEFTYAAASFTTLTPVLMAWSGGGAVWQVDGAVIPADRPVFIPAYQTVRLLPDATGCRCYLAVAGGWDVPVVLGSRSTCLTAAMGGLSGRALRKGDTLSACSSFSSFSMKILAALHGNRVNYPSWSIAKWLFLHWQQNRIRVVKGPEWRWFSEAAQQQFVTEVFRLSVQSNRMGYHLTGPALTAKIRTGLLSTAVVPGTVQVTGSGQAILLMADGQTTGGYPRIAQIAAVDLPLCGQLRPGDPVFFEVVTRQQAEALYFEQEKGLVKLLLSVSMVEGLSGR